MLNATNSLFKKLSSLLHAQGKRYLHFLHFRFCGVILEPKMTFLYTTTVTTTAASTTTNTITTTTTTNKVHDVEMSP